MNTLEMNFKNAPRDVRGLNQTALPNGLVLIEWAAAAFRSYLDRNALTHYQVFTCSFDFWQADRYCIKGSRLDAWESLPTLSGGENVVRLTERDDGVRIWSSGVLRLNDHNSAIGRWQYYRPDGSLAFFHLVAAPSVKEVNALRKFLRDQAADPAEPKWNIIKNEYLDDTQPPRLPIDEDELILTDEVRRRIDLDVIGFFSERVSAMHEKLNVPYRRGVMLYGAPGNGKTSTLRYIGGQLPNIASYIFRPGEKVDDLDFEYALDTWRRNAPALLIVEDFDWLITKLNLSTVLNLLDGIEVPTAKGLMLIITTNHPEMLDSSLSNRPGRMDVSLEICPPDKLQRERIFTKKLPEISPELIQQLVKSCEQLSCAHLVEIARLSGLYALAENRDVRNEADVLRALDTVKQANKQAVEGFVKKSDLPFGIHHEK
ncbi:MAG TPA: AAA family ATPase [Tepidisphaeraceae bacterium]|nr:AAA family ATPase [Tepidisphaeraceae bacterium]